MMPVILDRLWEGAASGLWTDDEALDAIADLNPESALGKVMTDVMAKITPLKLFDPFLGFTRKEGLIKIFFSNQAAKVALDELADKINTDYAAQEDGTPPVTARVLLQDNPVAKDPEEKMWVLELRYVETDGEPIPVEVDLAGDVDAAGNKPDDDAPDSQTGGDVSPQPTGESIRTESVDYSLLRKVANQWALSHKERAQLRRYMDGKQTSMDFDWLPNAVKAAVDTYGKMMRDRPTEAAMQAQADADVAAMVEAEGKESADVTNRWDRLGGVLRIARIIRSRAQLDTANCDVVDYLYQDQLGNDVRSLVIRIHNPVPKRSQMEIMRCVKGMNLNSDVTDKGVVITPPANESVTEDYDAATADKAIAELSKAIPRPPSGVGYGGVRRARRSEIEWDPKEMIHITVNFPRWYRHQDEYPDNERAQKMIAAVSDWESKMWDAIEAVQKKYSLRVGMSSNESAPSQANLIEDSTYVKSIPYKGYTIKLYRAPAQFGMKWFATNDTGEPMGKQTAASAAIGTVVQTQRKTIDYILKTKGL